MTTDITELTSIQRNANIHRLSRLIAYAPNDELRQMAVEVEQYTEQLIEALEYYKSREERVTSLVRDNSKSWDELYRQVEAKGKRNVELVEALEKAQQVDEELCKLLPPGAEYMDPPDGGDVTPLEGVHRMVADYRQRIAELESRTVTVKLPNQTQFDDPLSAYEAIEKCKEALTAQGIKWEAE